MQLMQGLPGTILYTSLWLPFQVYTCRQAADIKFPLTKARCFFIIAINKLT
jgi:hypothetical protein